MVMPNDALCDVPMRQNSEPHISRLAAYSTFYQRAKRTLAIQFALTVPSALVSSLVILVLPNAKVWTASYALSAALLDALLFERIQAHYRGIAARTQELFDCDLLRMEWPSPRAGAKPDTEDIVHAAAHYRRKHPQMEELIDWYPTAVERLPLPLARLICQRTNCWWDSSLRKKYANILLGILILVVIAVFGISLTQKHTVEQMILTVYAPIAPAVLWTAREFRRQRDAAESLDKLRGHIDLVWDKAIGGRLIGHALDDKSREIQDMIFDGRSKNPLVFDWINRLVRPSHQIRMNAKAQEMVEEALASEAGKQL